MTLQESIDKLRDIKNTMSRWEGQKDYCEALETAIGELSKVKMNPQVEGVERKKGEWTTHEVARLLADMYGDECACNFNGNDEWLPLVCDFAERECPDVVGVTCWEQFLKHRERKKDNERDSE